MGYKIEDMTVKATPEQIVSAYNSLKSTDFLGEYSSVLVYLPYEHVKPYLKPEVTQDQWAPMGDDDLRKDFRHYQKWWRSKIVNRRGISCWRGRDQFALRMMLAGLSEWREIFELEGSYSTAAWKRVCELFDGFEPIDASEMYD